MPTDKDTDWNSALHVVRDKKLDIKWIAFILCVCEIHK